MKLYETNDDIPVISEEVYELCSNHLDAMLKVNYRVAIGSMVPFRGINLPESEAYNTDLMGAIIRKGWKQGGRKPSHTDPHTQSTIDDIMQELTGVRLRESSVFVSNDSHQSRLYGNANLAVLVPNDFQLFWIENIEDFNIRLRNFLWYDLPEIDPTLEIPRPRNLWQEIQRMPEDKQKQIQQLVKTEFKPILAKQLRRATNIEQMSTHFIQSNPTTEGMLVCDRYALVDTTPLANWLMKNPKRSVESQY